MPNKLPKKQGHENTFKLKCVELADRTSKRSAAVHFGTEETNIRRWKKQLPEIKEALRTKCIVKKRRGAMYPAIDEKVCAFVDRSRKNGIGVSRKLIHLEALDAANDLGINGF